MSGNDEKFVTEFELDPETLERIRDNWRRDRTALEVAQQHALATASWIDTTNLLHRRYRWLLEESKALGDRIGEDIDRLTEKIENA